MNTLIYENPHDHIAILTIHRTEVYNALNREVLNAIKKCLENQAIKDGIRVLILTGSGTKAFASGADIKEMSSLDYPKMLDFCKLGQSVANILEASPFITIAAVNGVALGGGLELALACDLIYASSQSKMGLPEVKLGLIPGFGGTQRLTKAIGSKRAKELIFSGEFIDAARALQLGMINSICEPADLLSHCIKKAIQFASQPFTAIIEAKKMINSSDEFEINEALDLESHACARCSTYEESKKAISAFLSKTKP